MTTLKQFIHDEAIRHSVRPAAIYERIYAGRYPAIKLKSKNRRVIFVLNKPAYKPARLP